MYTVMKTTNSETRTQLFAIHATVFTVFRQLLLSALITPSYSSLVASGVQELFCNYTFTVIHKNAKTNHSKSQYAEIYTAKNTKRTFEMHYVNITIYDTLSKNNNICETRTTNRLLLQYRYITLDHIQEQQ